MIKKSAIYKELFSGDIKSKNGITEDDFYEFLTKLRESVLEMEFKDLILMIMV